MTPVRGLFGLLRAVRIKTIYVRAHWTGSIADVTRALVVADATAIGCNLVPPH